LKPKILIFALALGLLRPHMIPAQGTLYLSNLGQTPEGNSATGSNAWLAQYFQTGTAPGGYVLNSIQLLMAAASGNSSGFSVSIYNRSSLPFPDSLFPGSSLGSLDGSEPLAGGIYTYTASGITLSPLTGYFVVITSATPIEEGSFNWSLASGVTSASDRWNMGSYSYNSADGSQWTRAAGSLFQFGVFGTAVPEPSVYALVGVGLVGLSYWRQKRQAGQIICWIERRRV
jgi:PEP-CTERM motif